MNAAEHKARAEHLLDEGWQRLSREVQEIYFAAAQVHATLALVPEPVKAVSLVSDTPEYE